MWHPETKRLENKTPHKITQDLCRLQHCRLQHLSRAHSTMQGWQLPHVFLWILLIITQPYRHNIGTIFILALSSIYWSAIWLNHLSLLWRKQESLQQAFPPFPGFLRQRNYPVSHRLFVGTSDNKVPCFHRAPAAKGIQKLGQDISTWWKMVPGNSLERASSAAIHRP